MDQHNATLYKMLGNRTVTQFATLPLNDRQVIFCNLNPAIAPGVLLLQQYFMGKDETEKQLVREAREVYYGDNHFNVRLHWLCEFMSDRLGDCNTQISIVPLVKKSITIIADLPDGSNDHHTYGPDDGSDDDDTEAIHGRGDRDDEKSVHFRHGIGKLVRWTQKRLRDRFLFTNTQQVTLVLCGGGLLDGSDLATHLTMKDISYAVRLLVNHFGDWFAITKMLRRGTYEGNYRSSSLRSYGQPPTELVKEDVRQGEATFEQIMQVEIQEWAQVFPKKIEPWMGREMLI